MITSEIEDAMKQLMIILLIALVISIIGCGTASREIAEHSVSESEDVFHEVNEAESPQEGFVDLKVLAQIKTHPEGFYLLESRNSLHGKPHYPFLFNIDGQAVKWEVKGQKEKGFEHEGCFADHDCGDGMRYVLVKKIAVREGTHRVFFGSPGDNYRTEFEIKLDRGEHYILELKPVYRRENYLKGIVRFDVFLNKTKVHQENGGRRPLLDW